jgi:RHS repeat-associated protein
VKHRWVCVATGLLSLVTVPALAQPAGTTVRYFHTDVVGSVRAVTDAQGTVVAQHDFQPFGGEPAAAPDPSPLRFAGKERDAETGLDYFGGRYYAPSTGRFSTVDPVLPLDTAQLDPQLFNRYVYVRNNPLRFVDPDGRCLWDLCVGEIAVTLGVSKAVVVGGMMASALSVAIWNKRTEIAESTSQLITMTASGMRSAVDAVYQSSRRDPYVLPDDYPTLDKSGKWHTPTAEVPDHVPGSWTRDMIRDAAETVRQSLTRRKALQEKLGEHGPHRKRIQEEERFLKQLEDKIKEAREGS